MVEITKENYRERIRVNKEQIEALLQENDNLENEFGEPVLVISSFNNYEERAPETRYSSCPYDEDLAKLLRSHNFVDAGIGDQYDWRWFKDVERVDDKIVHTKRLPPKEAILYCKENYHRTWTDDLDVGEWPKCLNFPFICDLLEAFYNKRPTKR